MGYTRYPGGGFWLGRVGWVGGERGITKLTVKTKSRIKMIWIKARTI